MKISYTDNYTNKAKSAFKNEFKTKNDLSIPRITKVCVNSGIGRILTTNESNSDNLIKDFNDKLARITGQKPKVCKAKKSISGFKLREGSIIGLNVTLRGKKMADFIDKIINIVFPRTRDFWGIDRKNFDKNGNLTIGIREMTAFPELSLDIIKVNFGVEITFVTNTDSKEKSIKLFEELGFPLKPIPSTKKSN